MLYLKSSFTDDENETIREYRHSNPSFPHQSTADQFFDGAQFGAYRALGQHIADMALDSQHIAELADETRPVTPVEPMSFGEVEKWFEELWQNRNAVQPAARAEPSRGVGSVRWRTSYGPEAHDDRT